MTNARRRQWLLAVACVLSTLIAFLANGPDATLQAQGRGARPPDGAVQEPGRGQPQPQSGTAVVLGQVVDATTGQPIADATVSVTSRIPVASLQTSTPGGSARFITGPTGQFVLRNLPKTNLMITVTAPGYVNGTNGQMRPGGPSRPFEIEDGQRVNDLKIRLWKYAVITGTVLDEAGEPAVGVSVKALRRSTASGRPDLTSSGSATTDDRGVYRLSSLTPGEYTIAIPQAINTMPTAMFDAMLQSVAGSMPQNSALSEMAMEGGPGAGRGGMRIGNMLVTSESGAIPPISADGRMFTYQALFYPAASTPGQASIVPVQSGEERSGIDMQLKVISAARVTGKVTAPTGSASMASVELVPSDADATGGGLETASATTAPDGTFTFLGVPAGQYVARVSHAPRPPMPPGVADNPMLQLMGRGLGGGGETLHAQATVSVTGADVDGVVLALAGGMKIGGKLQFDGSAPVPTGQQLQAMTVTITPVSWTNYFPNRQTRPGPDATFKTQGYPAGKYSIAPTGRGGGAWVLRSVTAGGRIVTDETIELRDADINDVVITYTDKISQITGTVRTSSGSLPAVTVVVLRADMRTSPSRPVPAIRTVVVPKNGTFTIGNITPGDYLVAALEDTDVPENQDAAFVAAVARVATRVTVAEGERPSVDLPIVKVRR